MDELPAAMFQRVLRAPENFARALVEAGYVSLEEIAYVPVDELRRIENVPEWALEDLRHRARQHLLNEALSGDHPPAGGAIDA
jgi:N utilization substance protein A